jgi:hypothetical protein
VKFSAAQPVAWADAPMVFVVIPTCPSCGSTRYSRVRTENGGDGSATKKVICNECSGAYKIVLELPESGNGE